jgi:hypothetical protein
MDFSYQAYRADITPANAQRNHHHVIFSAQRSFSYTTAKGGSNRICSSLTVSLWVSEAGPWQEKPAIFEFYLRLDHRSTLRFARRAACCARISRARVC